jgi:hypothetical protein
MSQVLDIFAVLRAVKSACATTNRLRTPGIKQYWNQVISMTNGLV